MAITVAKTLTKFNLYCILIYIKPKSTYQKFIVKFMLYLMSFNEIYIDFLFLK